MLNKLTLIIILLVLLAGGLYSFKDSNNKVLEKENRLAIIVYGDVVTKDVFIDTVDLKNRRVIKSNSFTETSGNISTSEYYQFQYSEKNKAIYYFTDGMNREDGSCLDSFETCNYILKSLDIESGETSPVKELGALSGQAVTSWFIGGNEIKIKSQKCDLGVCENKYYNLGLKNLQLSEEANDMESVFDSKRKERNESDKSLTYLNFDNNLISIDGNRSVVIKNNDTKDVSGVMSDKGRYTVFMADLIE